MLKPLDFLERVYGERPGWIDLPAKVQGRWIPFYTEWPSNGVVARRIRSSIRDGEDLYFSVVKFAERGRRYEEALPSRWLFADLDHVDPSVCIRAGLTPTICWASSPGRFQALWQLTGRVQPQALEKLNRLLTYAVGADKGGWDLTQVLRIPGTHNHKYPGAPKVKVLFDDGPEYVPRELLRDLRRIVPEEAQDHVGQAADYEGRKDFTLPARAQALLRATEDQVVKGERSHRLWELLCLLVEAKVPEEMIYELAWPCAWNKHREVHTGPEQLRRDIRRAIAHVARQGVKPPVDLEVIPKTKPERTTTETTDAGDTTITVAPTLSPIGYSRFMSTPHAAPRWLVEDIWTAESHGIIGGEPKTSKSTLALALGLSVASGRPFLGQYPVRTTGPVLIVQEENSDWVMQDRLARIAASYGLIPKKHRHETIISDPGLLSGGRVLSIEFPHDLDLWLVNHQGIDLSVEEHRVALESDIDRLRPALVILDPLYLMLGSADENRSHEIRPYLQWLLYLRYEYKIALAVVHHFRKQSTQAGSVVVRPGQRLMGNATLHGWVESSIYMEAMVSGDLDPSALEVRMEREFRNMAPQPGLGLTLRMGEPGDLEFEVSIDGSVGDPRTALLRLLGEGLTANQLAKGLGVDKRTAVVRARGAGCRVIKRGSTGSLRVLPPLGDGDESDNGEKGEGSGTKE